MFETVTNPAPSQKKKMSSSFYPSTCMVYVCLNCVADSQGPSWSQITVDSFHAKIQGLITEGHCIVVPDNRAVRTAGIYHPFTLCRRMKQPGMQPRWRNQPGGVCGRDTMFDLCGNRESSAQNWKHLWTVHLINLCKNHKEKKWCCFETLHSGRHSIFWVGSLYLVSAYSNCL